MHTSSSRLSWAPNATHSEDTLHKIASTTDSEPEKQHNSTTPNVSKQPKHEQSTQTLSHHILQFSIDRYLNPHLRRLPLDRLPTPLSRFLGIRSTPHTDLPNLLVWLWGTIGVFTAILCLCAIYKYSSVLAIYHPPLIIASMGAGAILEFSAIHAPLAQPRNALLGQIISAAAGVGVTKLFMLTGTGFDDMQWVAAATACAAASLAMAVSGSVYPPGGATAVLAATNSQIMDLGWMFVAFVTLDATVMLGIALVVNNLQRTWPDYWWTAEVLRGWGEGKKVMDVEKAGLKEEEVKARNDSGGDTASLAGMTDGVLLVRDGRLIRPAGFGLTDEELEMLDRLQERMEETERGTTDSNGVDSWAS